MAWAQFTLDTLIDNWGKYYDVCINTNEGEFDGVGIYHPPSEEWSTTFGILAVMVNEVYVPVDPMAYTAQDMYLISRDNYEVGIYVRDMDRHYKIHERSDYTPFDQTPLYVYKVKAERRLDTSDAPVRGQDI